MLALNVYVHPLAVVEPGAKIGAHTKVWHHTQVRSGAIIGRGCVLGKGVYVDSGAVIGDFCKVQNNVSLYTGVTLGDRVFVGPSVVFTNDRAPRASNASWQVVSTTVENGASIGANATIMCGIKVGIYALIAAGSVVVKDVEAHELVAGNPARHIGWVCACGKTIARRDARPLLLSCPEHQLDDKDRATDA